ncbi:MAG: ABC transporter substrate-binding protein [Actinomycetota bacterium]|nr:ABC transporter substrate-binding protein [Actinomycetota bacterium]
MIFKIVISIILIFSISAFLTFGCNKKVSKVSDASLKKTFTEDYAYNKFLNVGVDSTFPPFAFLIKDKISGFDIDIAQEIAERLGKELNICQISWDEIFDKINDPDIDLIISEVSVTPEREKLADFSDSYHTLEFIALSLSTSSIKMKEDLINKKVGMLKSEMADLDQDFLADYAVKGYNDVVTLINALKSGETDGILISIPIGVKLLSEDPETYKFLQKIESNVKYSIILKKGSPLKEVINQILEDLKNDGTYLEIYNNWFKI